MSDAMRAGTTSDPGCSTRPASGALMDISMSVADEHDALGSVHR